MVEQIEVWTCKKCEERYYDFPSTGNCIICGSELVPPVVYYRKDEQVERVKKSVFIEHLTEEQQKELWEALYG